MIHYPDPNMHTSFGIMFESVFSHQKIKDEVF